MGKLPHSHMDLSDSCENEWLCLRIAAAFGFSVPTAHIFAMDDIKALIVERFDRRWSNDKSWLMRLPQEDMCQTMGVAAGQKYEADGGPGIVDIASAL